MTDNDDVCVICLGEADNRSTSDKCDHIFCFSCIQEWCKVKTTCPLCRQQFSLIIHDKRDIRAYSITFAGIEEVASQIDVNQLNVSINNRITLLSAMVIRAERIRDDYHQLLGRMKTITSDVNEMMVAHPIVSSCLSLIMEYGDYIVERIELRIIKLNTNIREFEEQMFTFVGQSVIVANLTSHLYNSSDLTFDTERTILSRDEALDGIQDIAYFMSETMQSFFEFGNQAVLSLTNEKSYCEGIDLEIKNIEDTLSFV